MIYIEKTLYNFLKFHTPNQSEKEMVNLLKQQYEFIDRERFDLIKWNKVRNNKKINLVIIRTPYQTDIEDPFCYSYLETQQTPKQMKKSMYPTNLELKKIR